MTTTEAEKAAASDRANARRWRSLAELARERGDTDRAAELDSKAERCGGTS
jgi:hypothetical protein